MTRLVDKPISKLSILFLLSILVPGSILVYFSIQNIASQKELTEKRLLEEENALATHLADYFQGHLRQCAGSFFNHVTQLDHIATTVASLDTMACVRQVFVVASNGEFIWPRFVSNTLARQQQHKSPVFLQVFTQAEKAEFVQSNLSEAARLYRKALQVAKHEVEAAAATNGLARSLAKRGLVPQALMQYRVLADEYGSVLDVGGLPFAYYSLHQIIQLTSDRPSEPIFGEVENILSRFINGQIPLTQQSETLLHEVGRLLAAENTEPPGAFPGLLQKIDSVQVLLSFALREGSALKRYFSQQVATVTSSKVGEFDAIIGNSEDEPTLLLLQRKSGRLETVGFQVDLETLRRQVLRYGSRLKRPSVALRIRIVTRQKLVQMERHPLTTIKELSPVLPAWSLWIGPEDPRIIDRYIATRRRVYWIALSLLIAGIIFGVVLVLRDVSRERHLAQLRTDFVSNVSHELKTPLTSIRMLAETVRLGRIRKKEEVQEYLSMIVNESERLTRLINTVLDFSRIDQANKQYNLESTNLSDIVNAVLIVMENPIKEQGFELTSDVASNVQAIADPDAIEQALLNLLSNSMKYSGDSKEISIRLWTEDDSVCIQVADKGIGIPESEQERIFEKFYRAHIGHKQGTGGAGLGLTVVKHIVDAHDGKIELKSEVGEGSIFTIILPQRAEL